MADPGFPRGGAPTTQLAPTYDFAKFSQKLHEIERIWTGGVPRAPLRSATEFFNSLYKHQLVVHMESLFNVFLTSRVRLWVSHLSVTEGRLQSLYQKQLCLFVYTDANIWRECKSPPIALSEGPTTKKPPLIWWSVVVFGETQMGSSNSNWTFQDPLFNRFSAGPNFSQPQFSVWDFSNESRTWGS